MKVKIGALILFIYLCLSTMRYSETFHISMVESESRKI